MSYRRPAVPSYRHSYVDNRRSSYYGDPFSNIKTMSRTRRAVSPTRIPKYNPWYTAYTPYYPTFYRGYSYMITSSKDYLNTGFMQPEVEENSRTEKYRELQQQEDERRRLMNQTRSHYADLVGEVPQIGVQKDAQRTDYRALASYLSKYGSKNTTNLLRFLDSGCTKEPIAVEVPKNIHDDEDEVAPTPAALTPATSLNMRSTPVQPLQPQPIKSALKEESKPSGDRRPFRYASKGVKEVKVPKKRETETVFIVPETLSPEDLARQRIRRDTDFLMAGLVL